MKATTRTELRLYVSTSSGRRLRSLALRQEPDPLLRSRPPRRQEWRLNASLEAEAESQSEETEIGDDVEEFDDEDEEEDYDDDDDDDEEGDETFQGGKKEFESFEFEEQVIDLRRVTKVVKGGRRLNFRAVVVVGNGQGTVGVGNATAKEISDACRKASLQAKRNVITFHINKYSRSFPNFIETKFGAAKVMLRPAREGTGMPASNEREQMSVQV